MQHPEAVSSKTVVAYLVVSALVSSKAVVAYPVISGLVCSKSVVPFSVVPGLVCSKPVYVVVYSVSVGEVVMDAPKRVRKS